MTLHLLENYINTLVVSQSTSEGVTFSKGRQEQEKYKHYDKEVSKDKKFYNCGNTGHPVAHCRINSKETPDKKQDEEDSRTIRSSKSRRSNKSDINKLKNAMKNSFMALEEKIVELENEEYDLTIPDSEDSDEDSHFQFHKNVVEPQKGFQIFQIDRNNCNHTPLVGVVLQQAPEISSRKYYPRRSMLIPCISTLGKLYCSTVNQPWT